MREITGELWDYLGVQHYCDVCLIPWTGQAAARRHVGHPEMCPGRPLDATFTLCITTNGTVKANGECVMGRGCAREAAERFPGLALALGRHIRLGGNVPSSLLANGIYTFPVKHNWFENADLTLIQASAQWLSLQATFHKDRVYILPRPGCGNGHLRWEQVRPVIADILPDNVWVISL